MELRSPINLSEEDKLGMLQRLDQYRLWHSLDEKHYCLVCSKIITGREIQVIGGTRGNGPLRIICPTENCKAIPMDWVRPTDEVLIKTAMLKAEGRDGARPQLPPGPIVQSCRDQIAQKHAEGQQCDELAESFVARQ